MEFLTKDAIKSCKSNFAMEKVEIPEWDGFVFVRELSARGKDIFDDSMVEYDLATKGVKFKSATNRRALLAVLTACDEDGNLVFDDKDISWLGDKQFKAVNRIFEAAQRLNGMTPEKAEKNSETPDADSFSD